MKKNLFTFAALLIAQLAPVSAQVQKTLFSLQTKKNAPLVAQTCTLDSICVTQRDGTPQMKVTYQYNEHGILQLEQEFDYYGQYVLVASTETVEFDEATGLPLTAILSQASASGHLQPVLKQVNRSYQGQEVEDYDMYIWQQGDWASYGSSHATFDRLGNRVTETLEATVYGSTIHEELRYEYDSRQNPTWESDVTSMDGDVIYSSETYYDNFYDRSDRLSEVVITSDSSDPLLAYYYWSDGTTTLVSSPHRAEATPDGYYDLSGRHHSGQPAGHGLYIVGGRKVSY